MSDETPRDWRGTEITAGAPVIYGAPVGRSIELVEGEVVGFTKGGRVNVRVVRRAYQSGSSYSKRTVHVGPDRLTIINPDSLPPTDLPTYEQQIQVSEERYREQQRIAATHVKAHYEEYWETYGGNHKWKRERWVCPCGVKYATERECTA